MADNDDDKVIASSVAVLFCASAYLFKFYKKQHAVWVKRCLQKRPQYGVFNMLLQAMISDGCSTFEWTL